METNPTYEGINQIDTYKLLLPINRSMAQESEITLEEDANDESDDETWEREQELREERY
jgi:hypothetical protein